MSRYLCGEFSFLGLISLPLANIGLIVEARAHVINILKLPLPKLDRLSVGYSLLMLRLYPGKIHTDVNIAVYGHGVLLSRSGHNRTIL